MIAGHTLDYWRQASDEERETLLPAEKNRLTAALFADFERYHGWGPLSADKITDEAAINLAGAILATATDDIIELEMAELTGFEDLNPEYVDILRHNATQAKMDLRRPKNRVLAWGMDVEVLIKQSRLAAREKLESIMKANRKKIAWLMRWHEIKPAQLCETLAVSMKTLEEWLERPYSNRFKKIKDAVRKLYTERRRNDDGHGEDKSHKGNL